MVVTINASESGTMLWLTGDDGNLTVSGGEDGAANVLVSTESAEVSVDIPPDAAVAVARCLVAYGEDDLVVVARRDLDSLMTAACAAEAVLDVLNLGKPLRLAWQRLRRDVIPAPAAGGAEGG